MTPDELLQLYPRETLRWLRRRLGVTQDALAAHLGAHPGTVVRWELGQRSIAPAHRARLAALLAPHLATEEGEAFAREPAALLADAAAPPTAREGLRWVWRAGGATWEAVPHRHRSRNLAIAQAYIETDDAVPAIAARHGVTRTRVPPIARAVVYAALGQRPPVR